MILLALFSYADLPEVLPEHLLGWYANREAIVELVQRKGQPKTIIEVGAYLGESTAHFASLVAPGGKVYAIDWWQGLHHVQVDQIPGSTYDSVLGHHLPPHVDMYHQFLSNMIHQKVADRVIPIKAESQKVPQILHEKGVFSADLIYIDADHSYTSVLADCIAWYPFVSEGKGTLCGDDWGFSMPALGKNYIFGVQRAVKEFAASHNLTVHTNGWFWWVSEKP